MDDPQQTPEDKEARRAARRQRELDRIFQAGWDAAADWPPLTDEQIERIAFILRPCVTAPRSSVPPRRNARANDKSIAAPLIVPETASPSRPGRTIRAATAASTVTVYTAEEVAEILRCSKETVYRWARMGLIGDGPLAGRRIYRFTQKHIDDFLSGGTKAAASTSKISRHPKYGEEPPGAG